ncbi:MAG TPA: hypothetical protein DEA26_00765 [Oceanospirillales bacterium]|nr:hypothetical protein [Oceanospirillaceae bacterium]HBS41180.1 hypothetical protein [Oceanospirillales bacterium]
MSVTPESSIRVNPRRKAYRKVQAALVAQDLNFRQFAIQNGYTPDTVTRVVARYAGGTDLPRGRMSFRILLEISRLIGWEIVPGIKKQAKEDAA